MPNPSNERVVMKGLRGNPAEVTATAQKSHLSLNNHYETVEQADVESLDLIEMADLTTGTSGILNKLFGGRAVWAQLNTSNQAYSSLPKVDPSTARPYGWRAKTAFASSGKGGQSEGNVPSRITSSYFEVSPSIKEHATHMGVSGLQQDLVEIDDAYGALADIQAELGDEHGKEFERALMEDVETTSGDNIEALDRVTIDETAASTHGGITSSNTDIHNITRSSESWSNAVLKHNDNTNRALTLSLIDEALQDVSSNGGDTTYMVTGWDTWQEMSQLIGDQGRFNLDADNLTSATVEDADVPEGMAISTFVNHYQGRPIVPTDQAETDGISRIYGLDVTNPQAKNTPRMGVEVVQPTRTYLAGENTSGTPQELDFLGDTALAVTRHEVVCRFFAAQFQIRDLKRQG